MGSARAASHDVALKAGPADAGAPSREEAQPLARPAGEAEDTGGCAALDGRSDRKGYARRLQDGAQAKPSERYRPRTYAAKEARFFSVLLNCNRFAFWRQVSSEKRSAVSSHSPTGPRLTRQEFAAATLQ